MDQDHLCCSHPVWGQKDIKLSLPHLHKKGTDIEQRGADAATMAKYEPKKERLYGQNTMEERMANKP